MIAIARPKVLIIFPDDIFSHTLSELLAYAGYDVTSAKSFGELKEKNIIPDEKSFAAAFFAEAPGSNPRERTGLEFVKKMREERNLLPVALLNTNEATGVPDVIYPARTLPLLVLDINYPDKLLAFFAKYSSLGFGEKS